MGKETKSILTTGAIFALVALVLGYFVYDVNSKVDKLQTEIASYETEIETLMAKANKKKLEEKKETRKQLVNAVQEYVKILPHRSIATEDAIIEACSDYAKNTNVTLSSIVRGSTTRGRRGKKKKDFEEVNVDFVIEGSFKSFVRFLSFLERHENFLQVRSFDLSQGSEGDKPLSARLAIQTFRYTVSSSSKK
jgi:hypothetical protein